MMEEIRMGNNSTSEIGETSNPKKGKVLSSGIRDFMEHAAKLAEKGQHEEGASSLSADSQRIKDYMENTSKIVEDIKFAYPEYSVLRKVTGSLKNAFRNPREIRANREKNLIDELNTAVENIQTKMNKLVSHPQGWQYRFVDVTKKFLEECDKSAQTTKGEELRQREKIIKDRKAKLEQMSKDLDRWLEVHKSQKNLETVLADIPEKYRSLAKNMAQKDWERAAQCYQKVLERYQQGHDKYVRRFNTVCDSLTSRPDQLMEVYKTEKINQSNLIINQHKEFKEFFNQHLAEVPEVIKDEEGKQIFIRELLVNDLGVRYRNAFLEYKQDLERWGEGKMLDSNKDREKFDKCIVAFNDIHTDFLAILSKAGSEGLREDKDKLIDVRKGVFTEVASKDYFLACYPLKEGKFVSGVGKMFQTYRNSVRELGRNYSDGVNHNNLSTKDEEYLSVLRRENEGFEKLLREQNLLE